MKKYTALMSAYGVSVGIDFNFEGTIASTLNPSCSLPPSPFSHSSQSHPFFLPPKPHNPTTSLAPLPSPPLPTPTIPALLTPPFPPNLPRHPQRPPPPPTPPTGFRPPSPLHHRIHPVPHPLLPLHPIPHPRATPLLPSHAPPRRPRRRRRPRPRRSLHRGRIREFAGDEDVTAGAEGQWR